MDKRDRIAKTLKDEAKTKEELLKRQPEQLLEQYVSSCVKKIVTTTPEMQEEVKAQDVVSALKQRQGNTRVPKLAIQKTRHPLEQPRRKAKEFNKRKKSKEKGKGKPKNKSKGKGQGTATNKGQKKSSGTGKKNTSKGRGFGKGSKGGKNGGKPGGKSKGRKPSPTR